MRIPEFLRRRLSPAQRLAWYPPFRAMRIRVLELSEDWRRVRLLLPLRRNRNPGGSLFRDLDTIATAFSWACCSTTTSGPGVGGTSECAIVAPATMVST